MKGYAKVTVVLLSLSVSSLSFAAESAQQILDRSAAAYAALTSYRDTGTASVDGDNATVFATAFTRPDRLRFTWTKSFLLTKTTSTLVASGPDVTTSRSGDSEAAEVRKEHSLAMGVAGATGVSLGAARTIATLLLPHLWEGDPEPFGATVLSVVSPRLVGDEAVEAVPCRHVSGTTSGGHPIDLWIGADDHLVHRVDTVLQDFVYREVHREIRVNQAIPDALFAPARAS